MCARATRGGWGERSVRGEYDGHDGLAQAENKFFGMGRQVAIRMGAVLLGSHEGAEAGAGDGENIFGPACCCMQHFGHAIAHFVLLH